MPRPPRRPPTSSSSTPLPPVFLMFAEVLGDAIGRSFARAIHTNGFSGGLGATTAAMAAPIRRRGRPPKALSAGPVPTDRLCTVPGCGRESRSKGLCSAHYQAERRRQLAGKSS
ncbi:MAG: hypothetical protein ACJ8AT_35800 [Hyalangium sp.]|uniref:hypothetical protein n=1 Tax=Hyalangium sp. TaxID=2028555 RepID=UPI00389A7795